MLVVCPTPIGNLDDATPRQLDLLESADVIACEDTRRTGKLFDLLGLDAPHLVSYHEHNELRRTEKLLDSLRRGKTVALVSDAGTPGISDPGYRIVSAAVDEGIRVTALPGPNAGLTALSASGLPTDEFVFSGFPPTRSNKRTEFLRRLRSYDLTSIMYTTPHRVLEVLEAVEEVFGTECRVCIGRELTKMHEEYLRGTVRQVFDSLRDREKLQGEFVLVVGRPVDEKVKGPDWSAIDAKISELLDSDFTPKSIREIIAEIFDVSKSQIYDRIHQLED